MRNDARTTLRFELAVDVRRLLTKRRQDMVGMLKSCGISPNDVPFDTSIWRDGGVVHLERFVRDKGTGNILLNDKGTEPETEGLSVTPNCIPDWIPSDR